jgi:hypothetical protein
MFALDNARKFEPIAAQRENLQPTDQEFTMIKAPANFHPYKFGEEALAASRQVWLASLGAAAVTSDWVQTEAGRKFKTLVKEGTVVESRAVSFVGDQLEGSMTKANRLWKQTRRTVESTVKQAADAAVEIANSALPKSLPRIELPAIVKPAKAKAKKPAAKVARARKAVRKTIAKAAPKAKPAVKAAPAKRAAKAAPAAA